MSSGPVTSKTGLSVGLAGVALSAAAFSSRPTEGDFTMEQATPHVAFLDSLPQNSPSVTLEPSALLSGIRSGNSVRLNETGPRVHALQETLHSLGFRDEPPNSIFDSATKRQVESYQRQQGLAVDGIVGPATAARMIENPHPANQSVVHVVKSGDTLSSIAKHHYGNPARWRHIAEANGITDPARLQLGQRIEIPLDSGPGVASIIQNKATAEPLPPGAFSLTFEAEGNNNPQSIHFSRRPHWPGGGSGVTIGRGYDMKERSAEAIRRDLLEAGLDSSSARTLSAGAGLEGSKAREFAQRNRNIEISPDAERKLFEKSWREAERDVIRISNRGINERRYGAVDWERTDPSIRALVVDLRFRGDYTISSRRILQEAIAKNDKQQILAVISNRNAWQNVPPDRFNRRMAFAEATLK